MFSRRALAPVVAITVGGCAVALVVAHLGTAPRTGQVSNVAQRGTRSIGGWGRGGYPMVTGPAGRTTNGTVNAAAMQSMNWAGYAAAGSAGQFTSVSTSWTQSAVTCGAASTYSAFWAGLDGDGSQTVEQTGTEADCANGAATYQGWYEMFPNAPVFYNNPVLPGDVMRASVVAHGRHAFTLTLSDLTQGWTQTTHQTSATAQLASAEVIAEAPSGATVLPLSNFGTVSFTNALADNTPIGNENASALTLVSAGGVTEATPSALAGGSNFTVTWDSSGTATASPTPSASATPSPGTGMVSPSPAATAAP